MSVARPRFPLRYARGNVLFGREGGRAALYRLATVSYPFLPEAEKLAVAARLARLALAVQADFSLWRVARAYPTDHYLEQAEQLIDDRHGDHRTLAAYLDGHRERLGELEATPPEVFLAVSLRPARSARFAAGFMRDLDQARRRVEALFGVEAPSPVAYRELVAIADAERRLFDRLSTIFPPTAPVERATTADLHWLLRRAPCRGIAEPRLDPHWRAPALMIEGSDGDPVYEPRENALLRCVNAPITEQARSHARQREPALRIEAAEGESHQALLALGAFPEDPTFPGAGAELLFGPPEAVDFPVDAVVHVTWLGNRVARARASKGVLDAENVYREQAEASPTGPDWHAEDNRTLARELEAYLRHESRPPMLELRTSLAVGAPDPDELDRRCDTLQEHFGDVTLWRPDGLQLALWHDHLPRTDGGQVGDYSEPTTIQQFGAMVPVATHTAGSIRGLYIGYTPRGRRPILYAPAEAADTHRPTGLFLCGTPGSGKTTAAELVTYQGALLGQLAVDVDPKGDHHLDAIPELADQVQVIELSGDERNRGMLDPLRVAIPSMREEVAVSYFVQALRDPSPGVEKALQRAVRDAVRAGGTSSLAVIGRLRELAKTSEHEGAAEAAHDAAEGLELVADFGLGRLAFGKPDVARFEAIKPVTTIRIANLRLPEAGVDRRDYDHAEQVAVATLTLVTAFALSLIASDRARHKIIVVDEAYFLLGTTQGRRLLQTLVRTGRALNATVAIASQLMTDLGELQRLIGTYFIFGQEDDLSARQALEALGLDPEDHGLRQMVRHPNYRQGLCLMRDIYGRVAEVQIDLVYEHLLQALDTSPAAARRQSPPVELAA